jgi:cellulose synthase/poly-beta-1,6-N-acetylglucosamine synthase-like glycosyltransferase
VEHKDICYCTSRRGQCQTLQAASPIWIAEQAACFARNGQRWYTCVLFAHLEAVVSFLSLIYLVAALLVAMYGANALLLAVLHLRHKAERTVQPSPPEDWPVVTVQLPVYNELYVVQRLIDAVARIDYPRDRLQVQVLDDSTDETTRLALLRINHYREEGLDIELVHRHDRTGYKAGALERGLETARGELIAIFDADFEPKPDFLRKTVPHLVQDSGLGFVQTRWGYLNPNYSPLTRAQTIALDGHFVVEHLGRNRGGMLMNFNGTAGVWRRSAIESAGGWHSDTLTEDVDLSFRAQLAGWKALYLPEVESPAELPPQMAAFKRQQARWATGAAQCLVKLAGSLWKGQPYPGSEPRATPNLTWSERLESLLHLSVWISHPMSLLFLLLTLPMLLGQIPMAFNLTIFWLVALGPIFAYAVSQQYLYPDWKRRMLYMPVLALIGMGLALSNTLAIGKGLFKNDRNFQRTPKFSVVERGDKWLGNRYALRFQWITLGELVLALYALVTVGVAVAVGNYFATPFLLLYAGGYAYMGFHGLRDAWASLRVRARVRRTPLHADS